MTESINGILSSCPPAHPISLRKACQGKFSFTTSVAAVSFSQLRGDGQWSTSKQHGDRGSIDQSVLLSSVLQIQIFVTLRIMLHYKYENDTQNSGRLALCFVVVPWQCLVLLHANSLCEALQTMRTDNVANCWLSVVYPARLMVRMWDKTGLTGRPGFKQPQSLIQYMLRFYLDFYYYFIFFSQRYSKYLESTTSIVELVIDTSCCFPTGILWRLFLLIFTWLIKSETESLIDRHPKTSWASQWMTKIIQDGSSNPAPPCSG